MQTKTCPAGAVKLSHGTPKWKPKRCLSERAACRPRPGFNSHFGPATQHIIVRKPTKRQQSENQLESI